MTVHEGYGIAGLERESLQDAWEWAGRKRYGVLRMLSCSEGEQGRFGDVLPYFVHTAEQDEGFPTVAGWVWGHALDAARANPAVYDVENVVTGARTEYLREAEARDASAMHALGLLEESLGEGRRPSRGSGGRRRRGGSSPLGILGGGWWSAARAGRRNPSWSWLPRAVTVTRRRYSADSCWSEQNGC